MRFSPSTTLALGSLGAAIGALATANPRNSKNFFSKERFIGSMLGMSMGLAVGKVGESSGAGMSGLGALSLSDDPNTPLKRQPIQILRTDARVASFNPNAQPVLNRAALLQRADRLLIS